MGELKWKSLDSDPQGFSVWRCKIPGGWLVMAVGGNPDARDEAADSVTPNETGLAFVPDPGHKWDGSSPD